MHRPRMTPAEERRWPSRSFSSFGTSIHFFVVLRKFFTVFIMVWALCLIYRQYTVATYTAYILAALFSFFPDRPNPILGTQRHFSRNSSFRYTTILFKAIYCLILYRASSEAILGTQRYFSKQFTV